MIEFEERISKILNSSSSRILKLENLKSHSYMVENSNNKYFFKFSKERKVLKEKFGIKYFRDVLMMETPEILYEGSDYLVTKFEDDLEKVSPIDISEIIGTYQKKYLSSLSPAVVPSRFSREKINKLYERNKKHFIGFRTSGLSKILNGINEDLYSVLPRVISHGDTHNKNIFLTKDKKPFVLDFENISTDYPTFDISTTVFYGLNKSKEIVNKYLSSMPHEFNISSNNMVDLIIADTLRIAIYDTLNSKKNNKDKLALEKRIENNKQYFEAFL